MSLFFSHPNEVDWTKVNLPLLQQTYDVMAANPGQVDIRYYYDDQSSFGRMAQCYIHQSTAENWARLLSEQRTLPEKPYCQTTGCIAGWLVAVAQEQGLPIEWVMHPENDTNIDKLVDFPGTAARLMGLPYEYVSGLFFHKQWPIVFWRMYMRDDQDNSLATLAAFHAFLGEVKDNIRNYTPNAGMVQL